MDKKPNTPCLLYGLVLAGGKSKRMGLSKLHIRYHDAPQGLFCANMLSEFCHSVFISIRKDQKEDIVDWGLPFVEDCYGDTGAMGGILSAFDKHGDVAWLVLGCDMPFVTRNTLMHLLRSRNSARSVNAFVNAEGYPEPFPAIYEPSCTEEMKAIYSTGNYSLVSFIRSTVFQGIIAQHPEELCNINTPDDYRMALRRIQDAGGSP